MAKVFKILKANYISILLTLISIMVVLLFYHMGVFHHMELNSIDFRFKLRGPLAGWSSRQPISQDSLDVVIVDVDDESWRLMPWSNPYPRGACWGRLVENLSKAGAKVVVFNIEFDSEDSRASIITQKLKELGIINVIPQHEDDIFAQKIKEARERGTEVVLASKMVTEPSLIPPQYIQNPVARIMKANPETGLINDIQDGDGFIRQYHIYLWMNQNPDMVYLPLGLKSIGKFMNIPDDEVPTFDKNINRFKYGPLQIQSYGKRLSFLINYYGPPSGFKILGLDAWKTFRRYPLSMVMDTKDITLKDGREDTDWMDNFIGLGLPNWVEAIEDPETKAEMAAMFGGSSKVENSPFNNKIVVVGISVAIKHDLKNTPYYDYAGVRQLMPGVEIHANAIQTILDNNFIRVFGSNLELNKDSILSHTLLIVGLALLAIILLSILSPLPGGLTIIVEMLIFMSIAIGAFIDDSFWMVKYLFQIILPDSLLEKLGNILTINVPGMGQSVLVPLIAPMVVIILTYISNVLYKLLVEQKDKKFLKSTFGTYISPELIDQMYEEKTEPKLGGDSSIKTAFFTDIQSFSSFSEILTATQLVELLNEYLTEMTDILLTSKGTLDKYEGDAIVAFFGAPIPQKDHAYRACIVALKMQKKLADLREKWAQEDEKWPGLVHNMRMRIGINSGDIVTGNMGSKVRMNYTMMGDVVNTAARLEASSKQYGIYIQLTRQSLELAGMDKFDYREIDKVRVVGKSEPVQTYELMGLKGSLSDQDTELVSIYTEALGLYIVMEWDKAIARFQESQKLETIFTKRPTTPSKVYIERCEYFKENSPGKDWDGTWTLTSK